MTLQNPESVGFSSDRLARVTRRLERFVDDGQFAGIAASISRGQSPVWLECVGKADIKENRAIEEDTIFALASMTKPVTSVAAMMLYEQGHFTLNTPVAEFIPEFARLEVMTGTEDAGREPLVRPITMRHLFTHTSGLSYGFHENDPLDRLYRDTFASLGITEDRSTSGQLIDVLTRVPLRFQPGTRWHYSLATDVIGVIVELITGQSLGQFFEEQIFGPLEMTETSYRVPKERLGRLARIYCHDRDSGRLTPFEDPDARDPATIPSRCYGGAGLYSTIGDYTRFAQTLASGGRYRAEQLLAPSTMQLFATNQAPEAALPYGFAEGEDLFHKGHGFSLGTRVMIDLGDSGQAGSVGTFGWDGAFNTYFWVDPVLGISGVILAQHYPNNAYPLANAFRQTTYQAFLG